MPTTRNRRPPRRSLAWLLALAVTALLASGIYQANSTSEPAALPQVSPTLDALDDMTVTLTAEDTAVELTVKHASTPQQRARGLQHVAAMPDDYGVLFTFPEPTVAVLEIHAGWFAAHGFATGDVLTARAY